MSAIQTWEKFLDRSLAARLETESFTDYVKLLNAQYPLSPWRISDIFLRPMTYNDAALDISIIHYIQAMIGLGLVDVPSVLRTLWKYSSCRPLSQAQDHGKGKGEGGDTEAESKKKKSANDRKQWKNSWSPEEILFYRLTKLISSGTVPTDAQEAVELVKICTKWMEIVIAAGQTEHERLLGHTGEMNPQKNIEEMNAQNMALGTLIVSVVESGMVQKVIHKGFMPKAMRKEFSKTLGAFVSFLLPSSPHSAERLEVFRTQTMVAIEPVDKKEAAANKEIDEILDEGLGVDIMVIPDVPVVNSRAGLYIYLNSLLVARPLIDDEAIFAYLHNRYQGAIQSTIIDLILASFDILANATFRNEREQTTKLMRCFLINKVPVLLTTLSSSLFPPLTSESCIREALDHVDTTAFPTLSNMFEENSSTNAMFSDSVRQDFCFACCLHGLIAESSIEELLGDIPMQSLPAGGKYSKEKLVQQCLSDPERADALIGELKEMDGNVGAVSQAITEVIERLCKNKETMTLKSLCSHLAIKPSSLDVMLLFDKPTMILQPICELLDTWRYDEDQGEYQPVYEEFGSILLLVLSYTHRYNLSVVDLGIRSPDSFVAKLLSQGHLSRALDDDLTEQEKKHIEGWIKGLFDNERGGLGDELMSSCPPQDFYLLVPTLFYHIVLACSTKNLSDEALKGGLEYLVDTFLLPSLIPGITWLSAHLRESRGDANAVLQILSALITNPASISNNAEASQMLNAIRNIVAKTLEHSLRWFQRAEPSRQDVEPLSKALRSNLGWERRGASEHTELESWTTNTSSPNEGGLETSIRTSIRGLIQWGANPGLNSNPANYSHRLILVGIKMLGAKRVLEFLLSELGNQEEANMGVALDVCASVICAPDAESWGSGGGLGGGSLGGNGLNDHNPDSPAVQKRLNLREVLKFKADDAPKVHKSDPLEAETTVRLWRKVEALLVMPMQSQGLEHVLEEVEGIQKGLGLGGEGGVNDGLVMEGMEGVGGLGGLDMSMDMGIDMGMGVGGHVDLVGMEGLMGGDSGLGGHGDLFGEGDGMGF